MKPRSLRGFTLIELLIAVAVFAVMGAMAYGGLNAVLNASEHSRAQAEKLRSLQFAIRIIERDIALAANRPVRDLLGDPEPAMRSASDPLLTLTQAGRRGASGQPRSTLQRVGYRFENGTLYRLTWTGLDGVSLADALRSKLLDNVESIELRFLDKENAWQTAWPQASATPVPVPIPQQQTPPQGA